MFERVTSDLAQAGRRAAYGAALGFGASVLLTVGIAFLTAAAWMALALAGGAILAALVIGCGYVGLGLIGLVLATRRPPPAPLPPPRTEANAESLVQAFLGGVQAGTQARRQKV